MLKIDAHQHFWKYDPVREAWLNDGMDAIQRDFLPEDLQPVLEQHGFDGCVLVQSAQPEFENDFLLDLAEKHDFIKGVVGWVDLLADNVGDTLSSYEPFAKLKGFRYILQGAEDRALMLRPEFKHGISKLKNYNYTYDILIFPDQLGFTKEFVAAFPDQPFVIDHIAKPYIKAKKVDGWKQDMQAVAQYEHVMCKISGMVTEADWRNWKKEDFRPYLDTVVEAFGPNRIMYGSDWPVCLVAGSYAEMLGIVEDYFSAFSKDEQAAFFGGNAAAFYGLK
ncbi:amidohydrolase family protein [Botryobacter ruber]|uniref:amidohydrolase family protein n=1 Tax=Botryobacter ruber TaxID=2171629 RepID=UPI000E0C2FA2|nr:amidohydrolase family protein [Botryobacter ruber]